MNEEYGMVSAEEEMNHMHNVIQDLKAKLRDAENENYNRSIDERVTCEIIHNLLDGIEDLRMFIPDRDEHGSDCPQVQGLLGVVKRLSKAGEKNET